MPRANTMLYLDTVPGSFAALRMTTHQHHVFYFTKTPFISALFSQITRLILVYFMKYQLYSCLLPWKAADPCHPPVPGILHSNSLFFSLIIASAQRIPSTAADMMPPA